MSKKYSVCNTSIIRLEKKILPKTSDSAPNITYYFILFFIFCEELAKGCFDAMPSETRLKSEFSVSSVEGNIYINCTVAMMHDELQDKEYLNKFKKNYIFRLFLFRAGSSLFINAC